MTTGATFLIIGKPVGQIEGVAKVTGRARYTADVHLPGTLWGKLLRSSYPHARILRIDASRARALPGVHAIITGQDIPDALFGGRMWDMPVLARDQVRFTGERVAAVAAETPQIAEEAITLIEVDYEELPAVFDPLQAMEPNAPTLHRSVAFYKNHLEPVPDTPNVYSKPVRSKGDIEQGFRESDQIFEHTFTTQSHHQGYLEPHATTVQIGDDGRVHVWLSNKRPIVAKTQFAALLDLPREQIVFHPSHLGGDFGGKGSMMDAPIGYYLAKATGRPVKIVMTYTEELTAGDPRNPSVITMRTGVKVDGRLCAHHVRCIWNTGAYQAFLPGGTVGGGLWAGGSYRIPHALFENIGVYTNCTPRGHARAPGAPQVTFALETHMDMIAHALGMDPVEFRLFNLLESGEQTATGEEMHDLRAKETLKTAAETAGWKRPKPSPYFGRGVAAHDRHTGSGTSSVSLLVDRSGQATLITLVPDTGTGSHTVLQQIVAEELKLPLNRVRVVVGDSDNPGDDQGAGGSRVTNVHGGGALSAAQEAKARLTEAAAELLRTPLDHVTLEPERFVADGQSVSFTEVAAHAAAGSILRIDTTFRSSPTAGGTACSAQVAEVEVDPETGLSRSYGS